MTSEFPLPKKFGDSRLDTVIKLFDNITKSQEQTINWAGVEMILPAGMAIVACLCDKAIEKKCKLNNKFFNKRFSSAPVLNALLNLKAFSFLPLPSYYNSSGDYFQLSGQEDNINISFIETVESRFETGFNDELVFSIRSVMTELMTNAVDHSGAERYYMYAGVHLREFHIGILDMGLSIPSKLEQKYFAANDVAYLELALKEGVGTRRKRPGGLGLSNVFDIIKNNRGRLSIYSRYGFIRRYFSSANIQKGLLKNRLNGTWCFARFPIK